MTRESSAEPHWLDEEELAAWLALVRMMVTLQGALDAQLQTDSGLTHFEYLVMAGLSDAPDRTLRMSTLARMANGSLSRLSHVVKRLEGRGWVRREPDAQDGRFTNAIMTAEGFDKIVASAPGHVATVRSLVIDPLTKARLPGFTDACTRIADVIDPPDDGVDERGA